VSVAGLDAGLDKDEILRAVRAEVVRLRIL
jgi:hypothetical protein